MLTIHAAVFPFNRERAFVADLVESPHDLLKIDTATTWRAEVPASARITKVEMTRQDALFPPESDDRILDVDVVDAVVE